MNQTQLAKYSTGEWAGAADNYFFWSLVFLFSLIIKIFQYLISKKYRKKGWWRFNHCFRIVDGWVIEMVAEGKVATRIEEWMPRQRRRVAMFKPLVPFTEGPSKPYDFFGVVQTALHHIRMALGIGHAWDGEDGVPKGWEGDFCSEELVNSLGRNDGHLHIPSQAFELEELELVEIIETGVEIEAAAVAA